MKPTTAKNDAAPTLAELQALASLCSSTEWDRLITSHRFLGVVNTSLAETEKWMSEVLGRKISVTKPAIKNSGDDQL